MRPEMPMIDFPYLVGADCFNSMPALTGSRLTRLAGGQTGQHFDLAVARPPRPAAPAADAARLAVEDIDAR